MKLLSIADLCIRWKYSKAGIHKLTKAKNFPAPFAIVSQGKLKIFNEEDIKVYERGKPWLFDVNQKQRRQRLFSLLKQAREKPSEQAKVLNHVFGEGAKEWVTKTE